MSALALVSLPSEAAMTTTSITRAPIPVGTLATSAISYSVERYYRYESTGRTSAPAGYGRESSVCRRIDPATPRRAEWYHEASGAPPSHMGWVALTTSAPPAAKTTNPTDDAANLLRLEREHLAWHDGRGVALRVGTTPPLRPQVFALLPQWNGAPGWGDKVDWSKGKLDLVTKSITADEVRIQVRASTEHPSFGRTAHHELSGELTLMVPSGWPKRFVSDGSWVLPIPTIAGDSTILGTFQRTVAWTYTPNAPAPVPATPEPAPTP